MSNSTFLSLMAELATPRCRRGLAWRIVISLVLLALLAILGVIVPPRILYASPLSQSGQDPLVLAFYYTWFDENTWTTEKLSDLPAQQYASHSREVMGRHIDQARHAGVDALLVAWYGPGGGPNQTETNLAAMLDEAQARGFKIGVLFETNSPFFGGVGDVTSALHHLRDTHANHPAFLRADGRPVVFFWRPTLYGTGTWRDIRSQVDPNYTQVWISEGVDTSYLTVFDGHHLYSNTWNPPADLNATNQKFAGLVRTAAQNLGAHKFWVATVMPGYNDVRIRPGSGFARDRAGGSYYTQSWQAAIASQPDWVVINSFNEWPEGTYIEPSSAYGDQYLNATAGWSAQFKANGGGGAASASLAALPAPLEAQTALPLQSLPEPDVPTAYVDVALLNLRGGPDTGFPIVAQLPQGANLLIVGRTPEWPDWWEVQHGDERAWLFAPMVQTAGPLAQIPVVEAPQLPTSQTPVTAARETSVLTVNDTPPLFDPYVNTLQPFLSP